MAIDKVTSAAITDGTITSSDLASGTIENQSAFKNIIINGDMSQAQRATSTASITSSAYSTLDRFKTVISSAGTWTQSQDTTVPTGQGFAKSLKMDCTTADGSLSAGDSLLIQTRFEGQNLQYLKKGTSSAESLTLSFWVRSNKTGTYIAELYDTDNTRNISKSYTISSADTWEKKTITYDGDTTGTLGNDNGDSFRVNFWLASGTTYTSGTLATSWQSVTNANRAVGQVNLADSTSNEWYITGIQLEAGTAASDFEFLPVDRNMSRCQRYYIKLNSEIYGNNNYDGTSNLQNYYMFREVMRAGPTITVGTQHGWTSGPTAASATSDGFRIYGAGDNIYIDSPGYIADAEL
tara:strand:- start:87 stop:1139 length:1053 start_codon:yes stop_codon:yes gene_type:complete